MNINSYNQNARSTAKYKFQSTGVGYNNDICNAGLYPFLRRMHTGVFLRNLESVSKKAIVGLYPIIAFSFCQNIIN